MRTKFDLDLVKADRLTVLIHGGYAVGKTHLIGDMLKHEKQAGAVAFVNVAGEDGHLSVPLGLGAIGETVESVADFEEMLAEYGKAPRHAIGIDSMKALVRLVMLKACGGRMPEKTDYMQIHWIMENLVTSLRRVASLVLAVCPSDKSVDSQITGRTMITPDLPGREAHGSAGWFDAVGYMTADVQGPNKVARKVSFTPNSQYVTRQRFRRLVPDVTLPEGEGGWARIYGAVQEALKK